MSSTLAAAIVRGIRAERARLGLTQEELGERLGWGRAVVAKIETGDRQLLAHELTEMCRALEVGLRTLLIKADRADLDALDI